MTCALYVWRRLNPRVSAFQIPLVGAAMLKGIDSRVTKWMIVPEMTPRPGRTSRVKT
jgi:hypothetical protein